MFRLSLRSDGTDVAADQASGIDGTGMIFTVSRNWKSPVTEGRPQTAADLQRMMATAKPVVLPTDICCFSTSKACPSRDSRSTESSCIQPSRATVAAAGTASAQASMSAELGFGG
jgi:hypothetical protein